MEVQPPWRSTCHWQLLCMRRSEDLFSIACDVKKIHLDVLSLPRLLWPQNCINTYWSYWYWLFPVFAQIDHFSEDIGIWLCLLRLVGLWWKWEAGALSLVATKVTLNPQPITEALFVRDLSDFSLFFWDRFRAHLFFQHRKQWNYCSRWGWLVCLCFWWAAERSDRSLAGFKMARAIRGDLERSSNGTDIRLSTFASWQCRRGTLEVPVSPVSQVVGHSFGSHLVLKLLASAPSSVAGAVLLGAAKFPEGASVASAEFWFSL